jgi:DNA-binding transcriptional ArsR family regulator
MSHEHVLELDPLVHAPVRLAVLSILIGVEDADFVFLRDSVGTTDGNLSTHLARLEQARYVRIKKTFVGKKPHTTCAITKRGRKAFLAYLGQLERIVTRQRTK